MEWCVCEFVAGFVCVLVVILCPLVLSWLRRNDATPPRVAKLSPTHRRHPPPPLPPPLPPLAPTYHQDWDCATLHSQGLQKMGAQVGHARNRSSSSSKSSRASVASVLVVIYGEARGDALLWSTQYKHLVLPLRADVAYFCGADCAAYGAFLNTARYVWPAGSRRRARRGTPSSSGAATRVRGPWPSRVACPPTLRRRAGA